MAFNNWRDDRGTTGFDSHMSWEENRRAGSASPSNSGSTWDNWNTQSGPSSFESFGYSTQAGYRTEPWDSAVGRTKRKGTGAPKAVIGLCVGLGMLAAVVAVALFVMRGPDTAAPAASKPITGQQTVSIAGDHEVMLEPTQEHTLLITADGGADTVKWASTDPAVASVSKQGVVTAHGEGTAIVTATAGGIVHDSCTVHVVKPVSVSNGQFLITPAATGLPEVTIHAPMDADCFVYFKTKQGAGEDFAFYVTADSTAKVNAPLGTYELFYATGDRWYGVQFKFGEDTKFYKAEDEVVLGEYETDEKLFYDTIEFTLYVVPGGNMEVDAIDEDEFPI